MKSTNAEERCKVKDILDKLCSPERKLLYDFISDWDAIDGVILREGTLKNCGVARVFSCPCNFGSKPVVELPKEAVDLMREMAALMGKSAAGAVIVKFRNDVKYWRIDRELQPRQDMKRGKPVNLYLLPINLLKDL